MRALRSHGQRVMRSYSSMSVLAGEDSIGDDLSRALAYGDSALKSSRATLDQELTCRAHLNLALVLMHRRALDLSRAHTDSALMVARSLGDSLLIVHAYENMGQMAARDTDFVGMRAKCSLMLDYGERHGMLKLKRDAIRCIMDAYRLEGKWQEAFHALNRYYALRDSMSNASSREEILTRSLVEAAKREEQLRDERHRTRLWLVATAVLVLVASAGALIVIERRRRQRDKALLETKALRAQINHHFLGNAMSSIGSFVLTGERMLAYISLVKYNRLLRTVLENSTTSGVSLSNERKALEDYLDLERVLSQEKFDFRISVDPALDQDKLQVEPLIIQPFVENAIRHGILPKDGKGHIEIAMAKEGQDLFVAIQDDGVGLRAAPKVPEHLSLGTKITGERLSILKKHGGTAGSFRFVEVPNGTRVELHFPLTASV
jgi:two-component sensor histidine kinase